MRPEGCRKSAVLIEDAQTFNTPPSPAAQAPPPLHGRGGLGFEAHRAATEGVLGRQSPPVGVVRVVWGGVLVERLLGAAPPCPWGGGVDWGSGLC